MGEKVSRNAEGYPDPTFGGAWGNMRREEKQREAERMAKINVVRRSFRSMERAGKEQQLSMGEIIDRMAQDTESHEPKDTRQRYKGICPVCGKENWICKSLAMEMGINTGVGRCLGCDTFLHITYNPERQEMDLERFEDYQNSKKARDDVDKIAGNVGYGGQDDDRI